MFWGLFSIVPESCRLRVIKRIAQEYFRLHGSGRQMKPKLTGKSIGYIIRELKKGRDTGTVAREMRVTRWHVQRLWAEYLESEAPHVQCPVGRSKDPAPSDEEIQTVLAAHASRPEGVVRTAKRSRGPDMI